MFDNQYDFVGKHGKYVIALTSEFDSEKHVLYKTVMPPIIGFMYGRKSKIDKSTIDKKSIFLEQINKIRDDLDFSYKLIMLLDKNNENNEKERMNKAFNYIGTEKSKKDELLFEEYLLGGIEILYEKLVLPAKKPEDYLGNLIDFLDEYNNKFNMDLSQEDLIELCRYAKKR